MPKKFENIDKILNSFRWENKKVRHNHTFDLRFRSKFQSEFNSNIVASSNVSRAPMLTNKINNIEMCMKLISKKAATISVNKYNESQMSTY
jgi:hypothetical protein